ncbi:MAG: hypothetical protein JSS02_15055 [Planctomycetes bacterium]|nr:hypothetical protein [Planctomycetota bacterium]
MLTGYQYWMSRLFRRAGLPKVRGARRAKLPVKLAKSLPEGFTIAASVESLESRQLLSGPTVNIGTDFQGTFNTNVLGVSHPTFTGGDFRGATLTIPGVTGAQSLPFAYCVDPTINIARSTDYSVVIDSTTVFNSANPPSGNSATPGYITHLPSLSSVNTNAIAYLAANIGPTVGDPYANATNYTAGMALQAALWHAEFEAPTATGWTTSLAGTNLSISSVSPLKFSITQAQFNAAYQADITALNKAYVNGELNTIAPGVLFLNPYTSTGQNQALITLAAKPTLSTTPNVTALTLSDTPTVVTDTATLTGGFGKAETGSITFTLLNPNHVAIYSETVPVNGDGSYTAKGYSLKAGDLPGTYQWNTSYSGDTYNAAVTDNDNPGEQFKAFKPLHVNANTAINTVAGGSIILGSGTPLTDTAVLSNGNNPTGTITFTLQDPNGSIVDTETVTVNGNGTYSTPDGFVLPSVGALPGIYRWNATYSGDANNNPSTDNGENEYETVLAANPAINTTAGDSIIIGSGSVLTDTAVLAGGYNPTGTITFNLYAPGDNMTPIYSEVVTVTGAGTYSTQDGYQLPEDAAVTGTYLWNAVYSGDANNNPATDDGTSENQSVLAATPAINTVAGGTVIIGSGGVLKDTAVLTGGYNPTGTITFNLYAPGDLVTPIYSEEVTISAAGTYTTPNGYVLPDSGAVVGEYLWNAVYSGDLNNVGATDNGEHETELVIAANPSISTVAGETVLIGTSTPLTDTAVLSGGYDLTGTITFDLFGPGSDTVPVYSETVDVHGAGTYSTLDGYVVPASGGVAGTYLWRATYSGDAANHSAHDNSANEYEIVSQASPEINTVAGESIVIDSGTALTDTAVLTGGYHPTGSITFTLRNPSNVVIYSESVPVNGAGTYSTKAGYVVAGFGATTGAYLWNATYSGDTNNTSATDNGDNEYQNVTAANPTINTVAGGPVVIGSGVALKDTAVLSGGYNPTGKITFTLYSPTNEVVDTETVDVTGAGEYSTPAGYVVPATGGVAGNYLWVATYSGDANNHPAVDNGVNETETVTPSTPTVSTTPNYTAITLDSTTVLQDSARLTGGYNPTGKITFTLYDGTTELTHEDVTVHGNGVYTTTTGYTLPSSGATPSTYHWEAVYSGDANNLGYSDLGGLVLGTVNIGWSAQGGYSVIFDGNTFGESAGNFSSGSVNGQAAPFMYCMDINHYINLGTDYNAQINSIGDVKDLGYALPAVNARELGYLISHIATASDVDTMAVQAAVWKLEYGSRFDLNPTGNSADLLAHYNSYVAESIAHQNDPIPGGVLFINPFSGSANSPSFGIQTQITFMPNIDAGEQILVSQAAPAINTVAGGAVVIGSGSVLTDTAVLSGGYNPTGTITFQLRNPSNVVVDTETIAVNGAGTYKTPTGYQIPTTGGQVGNYVWTATYNGDVNNRTAVDNGQNETQSVTATSPQIVTTPNITSAAIGNTTALQDSAVLSGGYAETGTITFTLQLGATTVYTESVAVNGNGTYTTSKGYVIPSQSSAVGTYQWNATYNGDVNNNSYADLNNACERVVVTGASISGTKYFDVTGNGFSGDDTAFTGASFSLYIDKNNSNTLDGADGVAILTATSGYNGQYLFNDLAPGKYFVKENPLAGYVQTGPTNLPYYTINVTAGSTNGGYDFDNAEVCDKAEINQISYIITHPGVSGSKTVTDLRGNTNQGDVVTVKFYVVEPGEAQTLVSYIAPGSTFNANTASQQKIFQVATLSAADSTVGWHTLTVTLPNCDYQIDFVCGEAIDTFGPAGSNIFYSAQNRLFSADNDGTQLYGVSSISGVVYVDSNNSCSYASGETLLAGVTVTLTGTDYAGNAVSLSTQTNSSGKYTFANLNASNAAGYTITEITPSGYKDGAVSVGSLGGTAGSSKVTSVFLNSNSSGVNYNFGEVLGSLAGKVYADNNATDILDAGDSGISGVTLTLTGTDVNNKAVSLTTKSATDGSYVFTGLLAGTYKITSSHVTGYNEETPDAGNPTGTTSYILGASETIAAINLTAGTSGCNENFGFLVAPGAAIVKGDTATIGFWQNNNGQALINSLNGGPNSTALATWLAASFPNLYGSGCGSHSVIKSNGSPMKNSEVAALYLGNGFFGASGQKVDAQVFSVALATYVTNSSLAGGTMASNYGFNVSTKGIGSHTYNVGTNGAAFGVANNTSVTLLQLLSYANSQSQNGSLYNGNSTNLNLANTVFSGINTKGDIK